MLNPGLVLQKIVHQYYLEYYLNKKFKNIIYKYIIKYLNTYKYINNI